MRTLSYSEFFFAIWANHFSGMSTIPFVSRHNNHKIIKSVILFVFNRTNRIFCSFVMHEFPFLKASTKMFSHYKAMFKNITFFTCHRVKEIIGIYFNMDISCRSDTPTSLPSCIVRARMLLATATTFLTIQIRRLAILSCYPSFPTAIYTSCPYIFSKACSVAVVPFRKNIFGSFYFTYLWHKYIIPNANSLCEGVELSE